jgi:hypothetical protein
MNLDYSLHARKRMRQYQISKEEVESCLQNHEILYTDKKGNPKYTAVIGGRCIKVIVSKDNPNYVITVED